MSIDDVIWSEANGQFLIRLRHTFRFDALALLEDVIWGTGSTRYRIVDLAGKLAQLRNPYIFMLEAAGRLVAVCVLDRCEKYLLGRAHDAFHFVMIATAADSRDKGMATRLVDQIKRFCRRELKHPGLAFAYVEATTLSSRQLADRIGHVVEADMFLVIFSRFFPRAHQSVRPLDESERLGVVDRLSALYRAHNMTDFGPTLNASDYRVLSRGGEIIVGLQFEPLRWSVVSLPGATGWAVLRVLPMVPILNSIITPRDLRFLRFGNVLVEPGSEADLECLMESVLVEQAASLGLIMMDSRSPVFERIRKNVKLGILSHAFRASASLSVDFVGVSGKDIDCIRARPMFASTADVF